MRSARILSAVSAVAVLFAGGIAQARPDDTYQSNVATGNWNATGSWQYWDGSSWQTALSAPNAGDTVTVRNGHVITVTGSQGVTAVTVASGGQLVIDGTSAAATLLFSGTPVLAINATNGVLVKQGGTLAFAAGLAITGSGNLKGEATNAQIDIQSGELRNNVPFVGAMTILSTGDAGADFKNGSVVHANIANARITLANTLNNVLVEASAGNCSSFPWMVDVANAGLMFDEGSTSLIGYFLIDAGTLTVNVNVTTAGKKHQINSGVINGSATFVASGGTCP